MSRPAQASRLLFGLQSLTVRNCAVNHASPRVLTARATSARSVLRIGSAICPGQRVPFTTTADRATGANWRAKKKKGVRDVGHEGAGAPEVIVPPTKESMRATAYCTAEAYNFSELLPLLQRNYLLLPFIADDVYHIRLVNPTEAPDAKPSDSSAHDVEAFIFQDGTFATWGATDAQNRALMQFLKQVEENSYKAPETEWFNYCIDMSQTGGLTADTIMIGNNGIPATQSRLAYSSGLARSVKLASLEEMLDQHLEKNKRIPQILLQGKKLPLSSAIVLQNLGELFLLRGHLNLHSELLDSPDFCWSSAKMEDIFERTSRNLDVRSRISIFNKKLDYANELTEVIRSHLHTQHSMGLEWAIVILIMIEVGFQVFHTYRDWDRPGHAAPSGDGVLSSLSSSVYSNTRHSSDGEFLPDDAVEEPASKASSKERKTRERERERDETHARKGAEREGGLRPASAY